MKLRHALIVFLLTIPAIAFAQENKYCAAGNIPSFGTSDGVAAQPTTCYYTARSATPSPNGVQWTPTTASALSAAFAGAACGDVIQIPAGTTISGNFSFNKVCDSTHYITLQTSGSLPAEGTRITPCYAGSASEAGYPDYACTSTTKQMATISTPNSSWALNLGGASYFRMIGIEFTRAANTGVNFFIVGTNGTATDHIIFDQVYIHGVQNGPSSCQATGKNCDESTRGVGFTGGQWFAFVNGWYSDFWCLASTGACTDAQAINANPSNNPSGTIKVYNNFMVGAAETIIFGGAGLGTNQQHDVEIRNNLFFKPLTWNPACVAPLPAHCQNQTYDGYSRSVKNLFELKDGDHVLIEGNTLQNVWPGYSQFGEAFALTPRQYGGTSNGTTSCCSDNNITIRYNYATHICQVWELGTDAGTLGSFDINIHDNVADDMSYDNSGGSYACNISGLYTMTFGSPPHTTGLSSITINNGGTGCAGAVTFTDPNPGGVDPRLPVATATYSSGVVTGFTISDPGADLNSSTTVSVTCSGTAFSGTPVLGTVKVPSVAVQNHVTVNHNTWVTPANSGTDGMFILDGPTAGNPTQVGNMVFTNNIADGGTYGVHQSIGGTYSCTVNNGANNGTLINACWNPYTWDCNYIVRNTAGGGNYPTGAHCGATVGSANYMSLGFTNYNFGVSNGNLANYALLSTSPYHNAGTDGKDIGADIPTLISTLGGTGGGSVTQPMQILVQPVSVVGTAFISPSGSDSNLCTLASPCLTPQKLTTVLETKPAGQRVGVMRGGTYPLTSTWTLSNAAGDSGTAANTVTYAAFPGEVPIISGGKQVTGWAVCTGGTCPNIPTLTCGGTCTAYYVDIPSSSYAYFEQLYYNGERRMRPMTTQLTSVIGVNPNYKIQGAVQFSSTMSTNCPQQGTAPSGKFQCYDRLTRDASDNMTSFHGIGWNDPEVYVFEQFTASLMKIAAANSDGVNPCTTSASVLCFTARTTASNNNFGPLGNHRYLIVNVREGLQYPQQWYLDQDPNNTGTKQTTARLFYLAASGENPTTDTIIVPQVTKLMNMTGLAYVNFQGLYWEYGSWVVPANGLPSSAHAASLPAQISCTSCKQILFNQDAFAHNGAWTLEFEGANGTGGSTTGSTVQNSAFWDMGVGGIRIGAIPTAQDTDTNVAQYITVDNNVLIGGQRDLPGGTGTAVGVGNAHHNVIEHNTMYDWYNGIIEVGASQKYVGSNCNVSPFTSCSLAHDNMVIYNYLHDSGQGVTSDMGAIHFASGSQTGNIFDHNWVSDFVQDPGPTGYNGACIYVDQSSSNIQVTNNIATRCTEEDIIINSPDNLQNNVTVNNNIFAYGAQAAIKKSSATSAPTFTAQNNIIYYSQGNPYGGWQWSTGGPQWLSGAFSFDKNIYWDTATNLSTNTKGFLTTDSQGNLTFYNFANWKAQAGQDANSFITDPLFIAPTYAGGDNFGFTSSSAYSQIGFTPIDQTQIGANTAGFPQYATTVPFTFPLQLANKSAQTSSSTTTALTAYNGSACTGNLQPSSGCNAQFTGLSTSAGNTNAQTQLPDPPAGHISNLTIQSLLYAGATTKVDCYYQPWFLNTGGTNGHVNIGMDESNPAQIAAQAQAMINRGCNTLVLDYYGTDSSQAFNKTVTDAWASYLTANPSVNLQLGIMPDQGMLKPFCPTNVNDQTACLISAYKSQLDTIDTLYGSKSFYPKDSSGRPLLWPFITASTWHDCDDFAPPCTDFTSGTGIYATVLAYAHAHYPGRVYQILGRFGSFSSLFDGEYGWQQPPVYVNTSSTSQLCWDDITGTSCSFATGVGSGTSYVNTLYTACLANPTKHCEGILFKGFDWSNASWNGGVQKIIGEFCGQVPVLLAAKLNAKFSSGSQLERVGWATWNDYEEGHEIETGVDNCARPSESLSGSTLNWAINATDATYYSNTTIDHWEVWYGPNDSSGTVYLASSSIAASATSQALSTIIPTGTWKVWVYMVGKVGNMNRLSSNSVVYTH